MSDPTHSADTPDRADGVEPPPPEPRAPGDEETAEETSQSSKLPFAVVGIGASAGGLEALEALLHRLKDGPMAYVVVQHLAGGQVSLLGEILARATRLRVVTITERMRIEAATVYVAPPDVELTVQGDELVPVRASTPGWPHREVDTFLRSLAAAGGSMAIGVILSGAGRDGTVGMKAIKDAGGITFVQEPTTATQSSMPQSAIDANCADFALVAGEIGDELVRLALHPLEGRRRPFKANDREAMATIVAHLRVAFGVDFALYKQSTVERRIARRMALNRVDTIDEYLRLLPSRPSELRSLYGDLLIGVTGFFRDTEPFELLKTTVFPGMVAGRSTESPIRIWVAGCSSGEEAYSVGITLLESLGERAMTYKIQIFATDIDEDALARARLAVYPPSIELDVSPERLSRFFLRTDKGYQVARQVRDIIVFARHNLGTDPPFSHLDLVTSRNVLIYMQTPLQKRVVRVFHYALRHDGHLLLGTSESVGDLTDLFSLVDRRSKLFVKRDAATGPVFDLPRRHMSEREDGTDALPMDHRPPLAIGHAADRKVLEKYGPPGVVVDEALEVLQFRGRTGPYLEPAPGAATLNLMKLARPELAMPLRAVINVALVDGIGATSPPVLMGDGDGSRLVSIEVMPLTEATARRCMLVLFREVREASQPVAADDGQKPHAADRNPRVAELERELATTKEYLQSTIEELEAANEELQSSIEEMQSSNEELQSTNEELETSKEELQSTNEELATVNDELHSRMAQLTIANDDLQNVLAYTTPAIVIAGHDLRIRAFSATAERLLSLIPGDVGRPITYLRNVLSTRDIEQLASEAIDTVTSREQRVRGIDGFWYMMKMMPYRTADHAIRGLVVELIRTSAPVAVGPEPVPVPAQHALAALPFPAMLVDRQLQLVWANRDFFETFSVAPSALGRPLAEAWGSTTEPAELWGFLDEVLSGIAPRDILLEHPFGRTSQQPTRFSARVVPSQGERPTLHLVVMQDV